MALCNRGVLYKYALHRLLIGGPEGLWRRVERKSIFSRFLERNSITPGKTLPLIHSTESYLLKKSLKEGVLKTSSCDVFNNEELLYFFVGRPAYKKEAKMEGEYWELPSCIIFEFDVSSAVRAYPFDSGAFAAKRYPNYINMMDRKDFEISPTWTNIERAIGAFFNTNKDYYRLNPIGEERFKSLHDTDATEEEILALHRLIKDRSKKFDDRRFSIEMQFSESFEFTRKKPLFCVFPEIYVDSPIFMDWINVNNIILETYPYYPLRKDYFYSAIYEKVEKFYRESNFYEI